VINIDSYNKKEKGPIPIPAPRGEIMWVYPDIIESQQWTAVTNKKCKGKAKISSCNVVSVSLEETEESAASLTDSEEEEFAFAVDQDAPPISKTWLANST